MGSRRVPARIAKSSFRDFVSTSIPAGPPIALTHMTDALTLEDIISTRTLDASKPCRFFREPLVYTFYLRPAYRSAGPGRNSRMEHYEPIGFLLKPSVAGALAAVFALDTGAVETGKAANHLHHSMISEDFELAPTLEDALRIVSIFYEKQLNYFRNVLSANLPRPDKRNYLLKSYLSIISEASATNLDERASAVEIQLRPPVALSGNVHAFIASDRLADEPDIQAFSASIGAELLRYTIIERVAPAEMTGLIYDLARRFYEMNPATGKDFI